MGELWQFLEQAGGPAPGSSIGHIALALLLAFVLGQALAWTYCWTHSGLSYSRSFIQSLILVTILVALVMIVVGSNLVTAFGLLGALAIIRFRNVLKDTRDTVFIFSALVVGLAVGSMRWATAVVGTVALLLVSVYLSVTRFGSRGQYDGFLRYRLPDDESARSEAERQVARFCRRVKPVAVRQFGGEPLTDFTFHVRLRDRERGRDLVVQLERIPGMTDVSLVLQEELAEV